MARFNWLIIGSIGVVYPRKGRSFCRILIEAPTPVICAVPVSSSFYIGAVWKESRDA